MSMKEFHLVQGVICKTYFLQFKEKIAFQQLAIIEHRNLKL
jgi:hypothetical protein